MEIIFLEPDTIHAIWPWVIPLIKSIGGAAAAGLASGVGRRVERVAAGAKASTDYPGGQAPAQYLAGATYGTQQQASQGQSEAFQSSEAAASRQGIGASQNALQSAQHRFQSAEGDKQRLHEKSMLGMELSSQGQSTGQIPWWKSGSPPRLDTPIGTWSNVGRSLNEVMQRPVRQ